MTNKDWGIQVASDTIREGLGAELLSPDEAIAAEVFRNDSAHSVEVRTFEAGVPIAIFQVFLKEAQRELGATFEDGSPIDWGASGADG